MLAKDWMSKNVITVDIHDSMHDVMEIFKENGIRRVPVMDHTGKMAGIIAQADIFRALASLTGLEKQGIQFALELPDTPGTVKGITDIIRQAGDILAFSFCVFRDRFR